MLPMANGTSTIKEGPLFRALGLTLNPSEYCPTPHNAKVLQVDPNAFAAFPARTT